MTKKYIDKLSKIYSIPNKDIELLISHMKPIKLAKGEFIVKEGKRNNNLYIVKKGVIRSFRNNDGEEIALWFASEGEVVIQVWGYCKGATSEENLECETDCELYYISKDEIDNLCNTSLIFSNMVRTIFESHSMIMEEFLIFFADNKSAEERYLAMIKRHPDIFSQVSLKKLASFLYITPQSLSRIRARLRKL